MASGKLEAIWLKRMKSGPMDAYSFADLVANRGIAGNTNQGGKRQVTIIEKELWDAADQLRANSKLTAAEYKDPVLGLILLRFAQNRYEEAKQQIEASIPDGPRGKRAATKDDFKGAGAIMLPEESKYDYLAELPESKDIAEAINTAMRLIETEYPDLAGILPKSYQDLEADLLRELVRVFNKDAVKKATGDVFGRIYEYFLMKFSMIGAGAQEGGEFFTPPSLVQLIVNFIEPDHGIIHDPACGSGGMFVQTGYFIRSHSNKQVNEAITVYGTEQKTNNTKLAKMNLAIHGIEGKIIENNSFYSDPHNLVGKCDFVMANPPFNVKKIDKGKEFVKTDKRLFPGIGIPKADNGNYLWMQYFYHYLNDKGRAGFVMASSATDAGHSEKLIRQKLIETGHVDAIVAIGNNFFYTRSLPCHLWFFDKGKRTENKDKILMIDARNVKRKVTSTINDFSPEQLEGLTAIVKKYRGEKPEVSKDNQWFAEHFPNGNYEDIEGLCKIVDSEEVKENDYSLTPGRYVGVAPLVEEDFDFEEKISGLHSQLGILQNEANDLINTIKQNIKTYGLDEVE